jgi:hypothetical protein
MTGNTISQNFASRALKVSGAEYYFAEPVAIEIIDFCEKSGIPILGLDGARINATGHCERIEWILDGGSVPLDYRAARSHVERLDHAGLHGPSR